MMVTAATLSLARIDRRLIRLVLNAATNILEKANPNQYRFLSMTKKLLPLILFAVAFAAPLSAAETYEAKTFTSGGQTLNYRIHVPEKVEPASKLPLVLFFHGAGERGDDNISQLKHGANPIAAWSEKTNTPVIIVAPQCPTGKQWVDTPWANDSHTMPTEPSESMQLVIDLLAEIRATQPVDESRIYVTGLSMGGFGTWDIIQRMPNTFAAAMPVCGGGDTAMAEAIKEMPIHVFHGGADTVVKTKRSQDMVAALKGVGSPVLYTEYPGVGHGSWGPAYSTDENLAWLLAQKKSK